MDLEEEPPPLDDIRLLPLQRARELVLWGALERWERVEGASGGERLEREATVLGSAMTQADDRVDRLSLIQTLLAFNAFQSEHRRRALLCLPSVVGHFAVALQGDMLELFPSYAAVCFMSAGQPFIRLSLVHTLARAAGLLEKVGRLEPVHERALASVALEQVGALDGRPAFLEACDVFARRGAEESDDDVDGMVWWRSHFPDATSVMESFPCVPMPLLCELCVL